MNTHNKINELLADFALGELDAEQTNDVEKHLSECEICRTELEKIVALLKTADEMKTKIADQQLCESAKNTLFASIKETKPSSNIEKSLLKIIFRSPIMKLAAAAMIVIAIIIGLGRFGSSSIAFGDVLKKIQGSSYTFDLKMNEGNASNMVSFLEPGRVRFDTDGQMKVSSILDAQKGKNLILFHSQKVGRIFDKSDLAQALTSETGFIGLLFEPVENLWNLKDGTEKEIGEKEIEGRKAKGFKVFQEDNFCKSEITIWADLKTSEPVLVEIIMSPKDNSIESATYILGNFKLDVKLDEKLFSLEVPEGYTLSYQKDINDIDIGKVESAESEKIENLLQLWELGEKEKAIELLMNIDWSKPITFSKTPYMFTITEKGYISLKPDIQQQVMKEILTSSTTIREITKEVIDRGQQSITNKDYSKAEKYLSAAFELGKLITANPDLTLISRNIGIVVKIKALDEMIKLYTETNNQEKLSAAEKEAKLAEAELENIKKIASGHEDDVLSTPEGSILLFCILPEIGNQQKPGLSPQEIERYKKDLLTNGPLVGAIRGDDYKWIPIKESVEIEPDVIAENYKEQNYLLAFAKAKYVMQPQVEGHTAWGLDKVFVEMDASGRSAIQFWFDKNGSELFYKLTQENIGKRMAIIIDGKIVSAPTIMSAINSEGIITGNITKEEAQKIANSLRKGMPPI